MELSHLIDVALPGIEFECRWPRFYDSCLPGVAQLRLIQYYLFMYGEI